MVSAPPAPQPLPCLLTSAVHADKIFCAEGPAFTVTAAKDAEGARHHEYCPLGDLRRAAAWVDGADAPRILVVVKGFAGEPRRVPLHVELRPDEAGVTTLFDVPSGLPFRELLAQELDEEVTALYRRVRVTNRRAGQGCTEFIEVLAGENPFVGGMEVVACVNGDTAPPSNDVQSTCSLM